MKVVPRKDHGRRGEVGVLAAELEALGERLEGHGLGVRVVTRKPRAKRPKKRAPEMRERTPEEWMELHRRLGRFADLLENQTTQPLSTVKFIRQSDEPRLPSRIPIRQHRKQHG